MIQEPRAEFKKRSRSDRNKWVTFFTGLGTALISIEQTVPGVLPPGTGVVAAQVSGLVALAINLFAPDKFAPKIKLQK